MVCTIIVVAESSVTMLESSERFVYVVRDGTLQTSVSVRYKTLAGSASPFIDYVPVDNNLLTFSAGRQWRAINITTLDGSVPVPDLIFYVVLYDLIGKQICIPLLSAMYLSDLGKCES